MEGINVQGSLLGPMSSETLLPNDAVEYTSIQSPASHVREPDSNMSLEELFDNAISKIADMDASGSPRRRFGNISAILSGQPLVQHIAETASEIATAATGAINQRMANAPKEKTGTEANWMRQHVEDVWFDQLLQMHTTIGLPRSRIEALLI